jgi:putative ABC transport system permease protein
VAGAGSALVIASMVVLGPLVARPAARLLGAPAARWRGAPGVLARENAMRSPRRMAGAATALMIGVGVVTLFTVVAASLSATVERQTVGLFDGDLVVDAGSFGRGGFSPQLAQEIAALPQVASSVAIGNGQVKVDGTVRTVHVADPAQLGKVLRLKVKAGGLGSGLAVAISTGKPVGSSVRVLFADGSAETFTVGAVYEKPTDDFAGYVVPRSSWTEHYPQSQDARIYLNLRPGTSDGKEAVTQVAAKFGSPDVQTRAEFVDAQTQAVRNVLSVIYVMLAFAIVIALMGITNTLSLAVHERLRELGLLRAVGATRAQIRSMVRWESVTVSLFGTAGGAGLGMFLAWVLSAAGNSSYSVPAVQMIVIILVGGFAGALSAIRPARRAARLRIISALGAP